MNHEISVTENTDQDLTSYFDIASKRMVEFYRLLIALFGVFLVIAVIYDHTVKPTFIAVAAITPPRDALNANSLDSASSISSITRKLGFGGASTGNFDLFDQYIRVLQSYRLAAELNKRNDFLALAFPAEWDPQTKRFRQRTGVVASVVDGTKQILGLPLASPSPEDKIFLLLQDSLSVSVPQGGNTSITEVSFRYNDAVAAQQLLSIILERADFLMRSDKHKDIAARISYLQDQLTTTTQSDQRAAIISLLTVQQNTMMMISADQRYASSVVEPPHTPQKPIWPSLTGIVGLALFLAFVAWSAMIFMVSPNSRLLAPFSRDRKIFSWRQSAAEEHNSYDAKSVPR